MSQDRLDQIVNNHLVHDGKRCPRCYSEDIIEVGDSQYRRGIARQQRLCRSCMSTWTDIFAMISAEVHPDDFDEIIPREYLRGHGTWCPKCDAQDAMQAMSPIWNDRLPAVQQVACTKCNTPVTHYLVLTNAEMHWYAYE